MRRLLKRGRTPDATPALPLTFHEHTKHTKQEQRQVKITEVEAIVLRQPVVDGAIADGSQDDLIVRVHTDEGIVGIGEVDSAPEVVKAVFDAPNSHYIATGLRHVLIGADPMDIEGLWRRMYMGSVYY